jgi:hypothetical protein
MSLHSITNFLQKNFASRMQSACFFALAKPNLSESSTHAAQAQVFFNIKNEKKAKYFGQSKKSL